MIGQVFSAFGAIIKSIFSGHTGFLRYIVMSTILSICVILGLVYGGHALAEQLGVWIVDLIPGEWKYTDLTVKILSWVAGVGVLLLLMKHIVLMILSPVLSNVVQTMLGDHTSSGMSFGASTSRAIRFNILLIVKELGWTLLLFLLSLIPVIGFLFMITLFVVQFYFAGCGLFDYFLERKYNFKETLVVCRSQKWGAIIIGGFFMVLLIIPFLGVVLGPYLGVRASVKYLESAG